MWSWQVLDCPVCAQPKGSKCRTLKTGRVTDTHIARIDKAHDMTWREKFEAAGRAEL
jgi:hypothetical protein